MHDLVLYYICRLPEVCVYYYAEFDGYHHAIFLRDFLEKSHEARPKKNLETILEFFHTL